MINNAHICTQSFPWTVYLHTHHLVCFSNMDQLAAPRNNFVSEKWKLMASYETAKGELEAASSSPWEQGQQGETSLLSLQSWSVMKYCNLQLLRFTCK